VNAAVRDDRAATLAGACRLLAVAVRDERGLRLWLNRQRWPCAQTGPTGFGARLGDSKVVIEDELRLRTPTSTDTAGCCGARCARDMEYIMWLVLSRAPLPDAPYWPGRRTLAVIDAVAWPAVWIAIASLIPPPTGVLGLVVIAVALMAGVARAHRAARQNHRYRFTTWRWGRWVLALLVIGLVLKSLLT
jgi:hypothetical protein